MVSESATGPARKIAIVGASARAAAAAALRAGFAPFAVDCFGDADLVAAAPGRVAPLERYPHGLIDALAEAPASPWMYLGGLENYPDLVASVDRPLWGCGPETLRAVRDPERFARAMAAAGFRTPRLASDASGPGRWLRKPRRSAGGLGVRFADSHMSLSVGEVCQEYVDGEPGSAVYVARADGTCACLGATRMLVGCDWVHAPGPFVYAGSIGPFATTDAMVRLGVAATGAFGLRGLFGVDFVDTGTELVPLEVNPRLPASFEVLERATGQIVFVEHAAAFGVAVDAAPASRAPRVVGKAILYAPADATFPASGPWDASLVLGLASLDADYADLPHPGAPLRRGAPVLTCFAEGATADAVMRSLRESVERVTNAISGFGVASSGACGRPSLPSPG